MKRILIIGTVLLYILQSCSDPSKEAKNDQYPTVTEQPNIVLIMTDDQGFGDIGFHGNPYIKTPTLDALAAKSSLFSQFYVSPVCAPTRSSLMTGRFSIRTGVFDTYNGGAIMATEETTIAEILSANGYKTGIFGKWHLGDNYPFRPQDQGFQESLVHPSGGIGQVGDTYNYYRFDSSYFDPTLLKNGTPVTTKGYCSDVFTDGAINFIREQSNKKAPFFTYLAFNAPHTPLQVPQEYYDLYEGTAFDRDSFGIKEHYPSLSEKDKEDARKVYGMVTNIDDNLRRLMETLESEGLEDNTIVIFLTDNGPQQHRYRAGLRQRKGSVFEGGVRVPCFMHFPEKYNAATEVHSLSAHIDILPTVLDYAGISLPDSIELDGMSLKPALGGEVASYQDRTLYFHWRRGFPDKYWNMAIRKGDYKLVGQTAYDSPVSDFELFNISQDPYEQNNLVGKNADVANALKQQLDEWLQETVANPNTLRELYAQIGTEHENPVILNRNDAKGKPGIWRQDDIYGYWDVDFVESGNYDFRIHLRDTMKINGTLHLEFEPFHYSVPVDLERAKMIELKDVQVQAGQYRLEPYIFPNRGGQGSPNFIFPFYLEIEKL